MGDELIGKTLGNCIVRRKLGAGGMGTVYLAEHTGLHRPVALKVLKGAFAEEPEFIQRFLREARLAARLEHPNVVQVFDVGEQDGTYYLSMQFVEGRTLESVLKEKGRLSPTEAISVTKRVAAALGAAHELGIIHRDVKPANILISKQGVVKVADFGLAKDVDGNKSLSQTGEVMGTPYYMSPEQAKGENVGPPSDLYSLGATLYHMATGRRAFEGNTPLSIVVKHLNEDPVPPGETTPTLPPALCEVISTLMAKDPADRYASTDELLQALGGTRTPDAKKTAIWKRYGPVVPAVAMVLFALLLGTIISGRRKPEPPPPAPPAPPVEVAVEDPPPAPPPGVEEAPQKKPKPSKKPHKSSSVLDGFTDRNERRMAEQLLARADEFMATMRDKDAEAALNFMDRQAFGALSEKALSDMVTRLFNDKRVLETDMIGYEVTELELQRSRGPLRAARARMLVTYRLKSPKSEIILTVPDRELHWIRRVGGWLLTRAQKKP